MTVLLTYLDLIGQLNHIENDERLQRLMVNRIYNICKLKEWLLGHQD